MSAPLLEVEGIDVAYGQTQVLFGVDLTVDEGEIVALLGTNGAGKSTVLRAVSGLAPPSRGRVVFGGRDITGVAPATAARLGISQVPGGRGVFPTLSVADNLRSSAWLFRKDRRRIAEATEYVLEQFPVLGERWDTPAGNLSGGEQQMLSLGQAFLARPRLLMIDELSLGLAPVVVDRLLAIVDAIHAAGTTVVLVEQSVRTALRVAERAVFLEKGEVRFTGATADLLERGDILRAVYLRGAAAVAGDRTTRRTPRRARGRTGPSGAAPAAAPDGHGQANGSGWSRPAAVVLAAEGITRRYGGLTAVDGVSLELHRGEILGLIGPNGAGKTTVLDLLTGFGPPDSGRIVVDGRDVTPLAAHERARLGIGRSFQDARLWASLSVSEAIAVATERTVSTGDALSALLATPAARQSERATGSRVDELVELFGLGAFRDKFVGELSTGSRRMVELACLVANRPRILLLDEPSSGIAQKEAEALTDVLLRLRDHLDASVVVIEHDMRLLTSIAHRLLALESGRFVTTGPADEVLAHPVVVASYLGEREPAR